MGVGLGFGFGFGFGLGFGFRVMVGTAVATEPLDVLDFAVGDLHDVLALEACAQAAGRAHESRLQLGYAIGARLVVGGARGVGRWLLEVGAG